MQAGSRPRRAERMASDRWVVAVVLLLRRLHPLPLLLRQPTRQTCGRGRMMTCAGTPASWSSAVSMSAEVNCFVSKMNHTRVHMHFLCY